MTSKPLAHGLAQNKVQQKPRSTALQPISATQQAAWHAGGQEFESPWLHSDPIKPGH